MENELTENEKLLAEMSALQIIRIKHLNKALEIYRTAYIMDRKLTDEEAEFVDGVTE